MNDDTLGVDSGPDDFLDARFRPSQLDRAVPRQATLRAVQRHAASLRGVVLDVGCGHQPYRSTLLDGTGATAYIGLDLKPTIYTAPDLVWDGVRAPVRDGGVDAAVATEVFEHVPDPAPVLQEIHRALVPGGTLFLTVPFLWPLHDVPYDEYRYTPFALERLLRGAGFESVEIRALGGWDASLAQLVALWVRRRPMGRAKRTVLSALATPVVRLLAAVDRPPTTFRESSMVTALSATARKPA